MPPVSLARLEDPPSPAIAAVLAVEDESWRDEGLGDLAALVEAVLAAVAARLALPAGLETELGVSLCDDAAVAALNGAWRGKNEPTNVLSFPMAELAAGALPGSMLGDVVLARQTVVAEAVAEGKAPGDHLRHLLVHGCLHCLGYDHGDEAGAEAMEGLEIAILADLGIADPYEGPPDAPRADFEAGDEGPRAAEGR